MVLCGAFGTLVLIGAWGTAVDSFGSVDDHVKPILIDWRVCSITNVLTVFHTIPYDCCYGGSYRAWPCAGARGLSCSAYGRIHVAKLGVWPGRCIYRYPCPFIHCNTIYAGRIHLFVDGAVVVGYSGFGHLD